MAVREGDRDLGGLGGGVDMCEAAAVEPAPLVNIQDVKQETQDGLNRFPESACHRCIVERFSASAWRAKTSLLRPSVGLIHRHCRLCLISHIRYIRA